MSEAGEGEKSSVIPTRVPEHLRGTPLGAKIQKYVDDGKPLDQDLLDRIIRAEKFRITRKLEKE